MDLIRSTLVLIRNRLNQYLRNLDGSSEDWVILSNVVGHDGLPYHGATNKVVMFLANITNETTVSTYKPNQPIGGDKFATVAPTIYIDLHLLLLANFANKSYIDGLSMISRTISFFQQNSYFNHKNLPSLDPAIDKLTFDIVSLEMNDLSHLMGMVGTKYLPSVLYKVRMIPFQSDAMEAEVPPVRGLQAAGQPDSDSGSEPLQGTNRVEPDDLQRIEGVGPKIEGLLNAAGLYAFADVTDTEVSRLQEILDAAGRHYELADPATWPEQARLAAEGRWHELEHLQDRLGRRR